MEFGFRIAFIIVLLVTLLVQNAVSMPKDSTVVRTDSLPATFESLTTPNKIDQQLISSGSHIPGRVWCQHGDSEPVEDDVCQKHCIPKGYSYGLCVSNTCSCM